MSTLNTIADHDTHCNRLFRELEELKAKYPTFELQTASPEYMAKLRETQAATKARLNFIDAKLLNIPQGYR